MNWKVGMSAHDLRIDLLERQLKVAVEALVKIEDQDSDNGNIQYLANSTLDKIKEMEK